MAKKKTIGATATTTIGDGEMDGKCNECDVNGQPLHANAGGATAMMQYLYTYIPRHKQ